MVVRGKIQKNLEMQKYIEEIIDDLSYAEVHQACKERFGNEQVPSRSAFARYWLAKNNGHPTRPPRSIIERDPELRSFIGAEKDGKIFTALHALCCERFGIDRTPSVSAIARYWMRTHGRIRRRRGCRSA